jgi:hypothetical protein
LLRRTRRPDDMERLAELLADCLDQASVRKLRKTLMEI